MSQKRMIVRKRSSKVKEVLGNPRKITKHLQKRMCHLSESNKKVPKKFKVHQEKPKAIL